MDCENYKCSDGYYFNYKCWNCGKTIGKSKRTIYSFARQYCDKCFEELKSEHESTVSEYARLKLEIMHERALRNFDANLDGCVYTMEELRESIDRIKKLEELSPDSFMSAGEIMAAIILDFEEFNFKINHKILQYKIDFFLPDEKLCIELDSGMHDIGKRRIKDGRRDIEVRNYLGAEWETIRIPESFVVKQPCKFVKAIEQLAEKQRKVRQEHGGMIPKGYSRTHDAYIKSVFE